MDGKRVRDRPGGVSMRKLWRRLRPYWRLAIEMLVVVGILGVAVWGLNFWLSDAARNQTSPTEISRIRDVVSIVQGFV